MDDNPSFRPGEPSCEDAASCPPARIPDTETPGRQGQRIPILSSDTCTRSPRLLLLLRGGKGAPETSLWGTERRRHGGERVPGLALSGSCSGSPGPRHPTRCPAAWPLPPGASLTCPPYSSSVAPKGQRRKVASGGREDSPAQPSHACSGQPSTQAQGGLLGVFGRPGAWHR